MGGGGCCMHLGQGSVAAEFPGNLAAHLQLNVLLQAVQLMGCQSNWQSALNSQPQKLLFLRAVCFLGARTPGSPLQVQTCT